MDDRTNMAFERIAGLTVKQSAFLMEYAKTENLSQACRVAGSKPPHARKDNGKQGL